MSEREQAEQFDQAWEASARQPESSPVGGPPEPVQQALDMASRLSRLDYSSESQLRESLRRQLQEQYAAVPPLRQKKFNWMGGLAALGSVAGLAILMACFVLGFSWIIRSFLPGGGPASEGPPGVANLPATSLPPAASLESSPTPAVVAAAPTPVQSLETLPPVLGVESSPDTIRTQMQDPAWKTIWLQGDILTEDEDGQPAVVQVEAWMDKEGRGRVLSSAPLGTQALEQPFNPGREPSQAWVSDGQVAQRLDRESGDFDSASLDPGASGQLLELAGPILDLLYSLNLPGSTEGMDILENTTWADRPAVLVEWEGNNYWIDSETGQILRLVVKGEDGEVAQEIALETVLFNIPLTEEALSAETLAAASFHEVESVAATGPQETAERPVPTEEPLPPPATPTPALGFGEPVRITLVDETSTEPAEPGQNGELYFTLRSLAAPVERRLARLSLSCLLTQDACAAYPVRNPPPLSDNQLHWARDGQRAALIGPSGGRMWRYQPQGDAWEQISGEGMVTTDIAVWSPDGNWIAVTTRPEGSEDSLITLVSPDPGPEGPRLRTFAQDLGGLQIPLGWQDPGQLVFLRSENPPKDSTAPQEDPGLFRLDIRSGEVEELDIDGNRAWLGDYPALTRAGGRMALTLEDGDEAGLAVYNLESGETDRLEQAGRRPVWSPRGDRIAYLATRETDSGPLVQVVVTDDSGVDQWTVFEWSSVPQVEWLPDGEHLLVAASPAGEESPADRATFYLVSVENGAARPLALRGAGMEFEFIAPAVRPANGE